MLEIDGRRGSIRFHALTLEVMAAYWVAECSQGNQQVLTLVTALRGLSTDFTTKIQPG
ncbi:hypothetical protein U2F10_24220 [Leptothoe sp. EHU-05/26/07-4]